MSQVSKCLKEGVKTSRGWEGRTKPAEPHKDPSRRTKVIKGLARGCMVVGCVGSTSSGRRGRPVWLVEQGTRIYLKEHESSLSYTSDEDRFAEHGSTRGYFEGEQTSFAVNGS